MPLLLKIGAATSQTLRSATRQVPVRDFCGLPLLELGFVFSVSRHWYYYIFHSYFLLNYKHSILLHDSEIVILTL